MPQASHVPDGNPCSKCGKPLLSHRTEHDFKPGCCPLPERLHVKHKHVLALPQNERPFYGIDGEGQTLSNCCEAPYDEKTSTCLGCNKPAEGKHRYTLLAAASEDGAVQRSTRHAPKGLPTHECLDFLLSLPKEIVCFGFGFGYDRTMILRDLPDQLLWRLLRPDMRQVVTASGFIKAKNVYWSPYGEKYGATVYVFGHAGSQLTVRKGTWRNKNGKPFATESGRRFVLWDIFKFYQTSFVKALKAWGVGSPELLARMTHMKSKRADFDKEAPEDVRAYCLEECVCLGQLARKLSNAFTDIGIPLKRFDGPGSAAAKLLDRFGVKESKREPSEEMRHAVASAFFGGRFENSVLGTIAGVPTHKNEIGRVEIEKMYGSWDGAPEYTDGLWGYDISSAYPYQQTFLPCLEHGSWRLTTRREDIDNCKAALVHYGSAPTSPDLIWAPFPFRDKDGTITYPASSGGGWVWGDEYREGEKLFSNVTFREAWVLESDCDCQPFKDLPTLYTERIRLGKEGKGLAMKLAINSCYGKLAQSVGKAQYNCWIWAGLITSGCRTQMLQMLGMHKDRRNMLAIATDGFYSRERMPLLAPRDTGTDGVLDDKGRPTHKPLGGWEEKFCPGGTFFSRPGIYFPVALKPEDEDKVRARGIGRNDLFTFYKDMIASCEAGNMIFAFPSIRRFMGAKTSIDRSHSDNPDAMYKYTRRANYGQWVAYPILTSFTPKPKRTAVRADKTLVLPFFGQDEESTPYRKSLVSDEGMSLAEQAAFDLEQPDPGDFESGDMYA